VAVTAPRFLARTPAGPAKAEVGIAAPSDFPTAFVKPGLHVDYAGPAVHIGDRGIVIGHLFRRGLPSERVLELTQTELTRIFQSDGASLLSEFWGGYVAFLPISGGKVRIIRDPSGTIPAYWRDTSEGIIVASELGRAPFTSNEDLRIDAEALTVHLWTPHFAGRRTCIDGVSEILPGEALDLNGHGPLTVTLWSPWDHVPASRRGITADPALLYDTIVDVVTTWGNCFQSVLLGLSGGLDSSIVAAALASANCHVSGFTMYSPDDDSDERAYARMAADACGISITSVDYDRERLDITRPIATHVARPFLAHYAQAIANVRERAARECRIDAYFSGNGGDNVFCMMRSVTPIVDRLATRASPRGVLRTIDDIAVLTGADWLSIARRVLRRITNKTRYPPPKGDGSLLIADRLAQAIEDVPRHPWYEVPHNASPASAAHVAMVRRALGNDGLHSRTTHPPSISPLLSQPVMELCLGLPSWLWIEGGADRAVARHAFRDALPPALLDRRSKGGPGAFVHRTYLRHETEVLDRLRDGPLSDLGILGLPPKPRIVTDGITAQRMLTLVAADAWMRHWTGG